MGQPVYDGMPPSDRSYNVKKDMGGTWGTIRCGGACKDNYQNIAIYHQNSAEFVKLQKAAIASLKSAEDAVNKKIFTTGSWRACSLQAQLYRSDPNRFAAPNTTAHCRGLAIDVSQNQNYLARIKKALLLREWYQSRPDDEPWHFSFGIKV